MNTWRSDASGTLKGHLPGHAITAVDHRGGALAHNHLRRSRTGRSRSRPAAACPEQHEPGSPALADNGPRGRGHHTPRRPGNPGRLIRVVMKFVPWASRRVQAVEVRAIVSPIHPRRDTGLIENRTDNPLWVSDLESRGWTWLGVRDGIRNGLLTAA